MPLWCFQQNPMHHFCHPLTQPVNPMFSRNKFHFQQLKQFFQVLIIRHGTSMGKEMENNNKFDIFSSLFKWDIDLQSVQDKRVVSRCVTPLILCMDIIFVEVKAAIINPKHGNLGLVVALVFQQIVQFGANNFFFSLQQMYTPYNEHDAFEHPFH